MRVILLLLLLVPQLATAGVYLCVDPQTGKKTFTDRACEQEAVGEQLRVESAQSGASRGSSRKSNDKTWNSQRDERIDGREYRQEERTRGGSAGITNGGYLSDTY